jgi:hypothetical protein
MAPLLLALTSGILPIPVYAQETPDVGEPEAQNPSPIGSMRIDAGYQSNLREDAGEAFYYRLEYRGQLLRQKGTPFTYSDPNKPIEEPELADPGGDTNNFALRLDRGSVETDSGIFDALGVRSFRLPRVLRELRGAAGFSGRLDGNQFNVAAGLETPPFHPAAFVNRRMRAGITNWLIFGAFGERQERDENDGVDRDLALATYRAFAGKGFGWKASGRQEVFRNTLFDAVIAKAPTYEDAQRLDKEIVQKIEEGQQSQVEEIIHALANDAKPPDWRDKVAAFLRGYAKARAKDHPTYAFWVDSAGWYAFSDVDGGKRFNNLLAITGTWWFNPDAAKPTYARIRYENGRERAAPTESKHFIAFLFGAEF